jgi:spore germination protein YaaH
MLVSSVAILLAIGGSHQPKFGAWVLLDDDGTSFNRFVAHTSCFDSVSGQFYSCTKDGLVGHVSGIPEDRFKNLVTYAHKHHVAVFGLVGDGGLGSAGVEYFLNDPVRLRAHAVALATAAVADKVDGVDLDYESMKAQDKDNFSTFVEATSEELHKRHKLCTIALCAKDTEPGDWSGSQSEDYTRIGKVVDRARVMTYDEHEEGGPAGPVADLAWVRRVMNHALETIPSKKLEIGIPAYGYNWSKPKAHGINWAAWTALPNYDQATRDPISNELILRTADGTAWFCDSVSEKPKLDLARELDVRGVYMWVMGSEDPKWWDLFPPASKHEIPKD